MPYSMVSFRMALSDYLSYSEIFNDTKQCTAAPAYLRQLSFLFFISPYSVAFGVILSLLFVFVCLFVCTVEDISTQDGAIGVKFWLRVEQTPGTGTK